MIPTALATETCFSLFFFLAAYLSELFPRELPLASGYVFPLSAFRHAFTPELYGRSMIPTLVEILRLRLSFALGARGQSSLRMTKLN
jgi:hypothetical protein